MADGPTLVRRSGPHRVAVDRHQFLLFTPGGEDDYFPDVVDPQEWVRSGSGWIHLQTGSPDGPVDVTMEAWSGMADPSEGSWDGIRELSMEAPEPTVTLWGITAGPQSDPMPIGKASGVYKVRLSCRDRSEGYPAPTDPPETWLIQFWPVA